ncbi:citrate lyase subunit beta/citryl-CoA lyase [Actinomycetospora succinea]|uniref:Citrate lyase subunit beta/citryl-CoA lyase n=1 Tax=Actinomycetospora succinea TaxID=663603 RepID=A0A4R6VGV2_9PSEU|nr:CoA ester lyase [Actinomycetospora succinea]TDQ60514.1 citrate lyase subunit beta/citryl-CoA lyase [Actinomycetospora succinea]
MRPGPGRARSWLYVPAHRPELLDKALAGPADAVVLDLEDAVPADAKDAARDAAVAAAATPREKQLWVRMNAVDTPWCADDVAALAGTALDGVRLPKAGEPDTVAALADRLDLPLHLLLESALGVEQAFALARAHPRVVAVSLGEADLAADLGVRRPDALAWARQRVVVAARAAGLAAPVTSVWTDLADPDGLERDSREARDQGFFGRSVIHPRQVEPVHRAFTPTGDEVGAARALLDSLSDAAGRGESAWVDERGRFVDAAVVAGAVRVLEQAHPTGVQEDR